MNERATPCCEERCCGGSAAEDVRAQVRERYGQIAREGSAGGCCTPGSESAGASAGCCTATRTATADTPEGADLGLSCGNPVAIAALREGEIVLDLGSGAGVDCFVAAERVGDRGRVIGVDMTPDMIERSRRNLEAYAARTGRRNIEFRLGEIEHLPVADSSVDVVISNCVLNLSPEKGLVWREIARVLRPGGRVAVSDIALLRPLPAPIARDVEALVGCVAGAATVDEIGTHARGAGLADVSIAPRGGSVESMLPADSALGLRLAHHLPPGRGLDDYIASVEIVAHKRASRGS